MPSKYMFCVLLFLSFFCRVFISFLLVFLFFFLSRSNIVNNSSISGFECGFYSYFSSRFSFSIHFFLVSLIFLFLDLEICFIVLLFLEDYDFFFLFLGIFFIIFFLLIGLIYEWGIGKLEWVN